MVSKKSNISFGLDEIKAAIAEKLDRTDFEQALLLKANKVDLERVLRNSDILHSQLSHIMVLTTEFIRLMGVGPAD